LRVGAAAVAEARPGRVVAAELARGALEAAAPALEIALPLRRRVPERHVCLPGLPPWIVALESGVVRMTYNDVMATTTVLDLADPAAAAAAIDALNDELAAVPALRPGMGEAVAGVASAVRATPLDRWT